MNNIKTPEELLKFMSENIRYGYLGKNGKVYQQEAEDFDTELSGTYYGIGAQIQLVEENKVQTIKIFDGSPAEKAGLKVGDIFVKIDGKSTDGLDASGVAKILRSDKVKKSTLVMNRDSEEIEVEVTKANVTLFSVSSEMIDEDNKIGYISVTLFSKNTYLTRHYDKDIKET